MHGQLCDTAGTSQHHRHDNFTRLPLEIIHHIASALAEGQLTSFHHPLFNYKTRLPFERQVVASTLGNLPRLALTSRLLAALARHAFSATLVIVVVWMPEAGEGEGDYEWQLGALERAVEKRGTGVHADETAEGQRELARIKKVEVAYDGSREEPEEYQELCYNTLDDAVLGMPRVTWGQPVPGNLPGDFEFPRERYRYRYW